MSPKNTHCCISAASPLLSSSSISDKIPVFVLLGPTAVGKTSLACALASELDLEILSCDSRQIYHGMNIGTAKPSVAQLQNTRHWCINIINPSEEYSAFRFADTALSIIRERAALGRNILICGGTGFYFKVLSEGGYECEPSLPSVRDELTVIAEKSGNEALHGELLRVDPQSAMRIHPNDRQRIIRALAVYRQTGQPASCLQTVCRKPEDIHFIIIKLRMEREQLYKRINRRVVEMVDNGLWEEFQSLVAKGYDCHTPGMQCVGYKELFGVVRGELTLVQAIARIQQNTRNYAKRQITWFSTQVGGEFFECSIRSSFLKEYYRKSIT